MKDKINSLISQLREEIVFQSPDGFCHIAANKVEDVIKALEESNNEIGYWKEQAEKYRKG